MRKITTSEVIKRWLKDRFDLGKFEVSTHLLELQLPEYGKLYYDVLQHTETYQRHIHLLLTYFILQDIIII